jgi:hypothetical protein
MPMDETEPEGEGVEKVAELNALFDEMLSDARQITKDLTEGVTSMGVAAALGITLNLVQLLIIRENYWRGPLYILLWGVGFAAILVSSLRLLSKWLTLKDRYARFFEINKELEQM